MYGGTISGNDSNTLATGGGVDVNGSSQGASSFTMYGGTISDNTATSGGGLYVNEGNSFTMYGGSICRNNASGNGGGVYMKGTMTISGASHIFANTNNYYENKKDNVCLADKDVSITITGTLSGKIGVNEYYVPLAGEVLATGANENTDYSEIIVSDNDEFEIAHDSSDKTKLVWKTKDTPTPPATEHKHCICGAAHENVGNHTTENKVTFTAWNDAEAKKQYGNKTDVTAANSLPKTTGNYYLIGDVTLAATWVVPENANIHLCMNGYDIYVNDTTKTTAQYKAAIYINSNRQLTLTDCKSKSKIEYKGNISCTGIWIEQNGEANIYNVTVTHCNGENHPGMGICNNGTVNMYNGTVCNNRGKYGAYGIGNYFGGTFNMYGGTISGNMTGISNLSTLKLDGNVKITQNDKNIGVDAKDSTITLANLGENASIGVALKSSPTKGNPVVIVSNGAKAADAAKFFVDNDANKEYEIFLSDAAKGALSVRVTGDTSSASGSSSSGTSSGGSGGASVSTPTPAAPEVITVKEETKDNSISKPGTETGTTTTTKTTVKDTTTATTKNEQGQDVSKTTASVSKDLGDKLLDQAVSNNSDTIEITVKSKDANGGGNAGSGVAGSVKSTEVELPKATVDAIAKDTNADLVIKTDNGELVLDNKTLETISDAAKGDTVTIEVNENTQLKETQKPAEKIVGKSGSLFNFVAKIGERSLHQFEGGKAYVTLPMPDKLKGKDVLVIYIDDNGLCKILNHSVEKIGADDYVRFMTTHFSTFAVVEKDQAEQLIKEQNAAHVKELIQHAKFRVTTTKTSKQNVKAQVTAKTSKTLISDIKSLGYTVKYQFYRSTKKTAGYKAVKTKTTNTYVNTKGTKGTKYYYKTRVLVYDGKTLVAKSTRKQCSWGTRVWSK